MKPKSHLKQIMKDYEKAWQVLGDPELCDEFLSQQPEKIPKHSKKVNKGKPNLKKKKKPNNRKKYQQW